MKLLIVGLNYAPEPVGIGPYTAGLAEAMARRGHMVEVIAGKPYYPQWRPYEGQPPGVTRSHENGVAVTRVPHYIPANPSGARHIAHYASFAARALVPALAAAKGADLVFAVAPSLLSVPVALRAATRAGAPLWLHIQDFEVEAALATMTEEIRSTSWSVTTKGSKRMGLTSTCSVRAWMAAPTMARVCISAISG